MKTAVLLGALALAVGAAGAAAAEPRFESEIVPVRWADLRHTYRQGCPVPPAQLRLVRVSHWGFDGRRHTGELVVAKKEARDVAGVFRKLWEARFPIRRMRPMSHYRGDDRASMAADNTSGFNCRVVRGTSRLSMHAYGEAIDVNTVENPYVTSRFGVQPPAGRRFVDRSNVRPGMAVEGNVLVRAFDAIGWHWGGRWSSAKDYQHFSTTGR